MNWEWSIRSSDGGMSGLEFARGYTAGDFRRVLVHAAPSQIEVYVETEDGSTVARGKAKRDGKYTPMTELTLTGDGIARREVWPDDSFVGLPVLLPGGEVGILTAWQHSEDRQWWKWSVEFSNHKDRPSDWSPPQDDVRSAVES